MFPSQGNLINQLIVIGLSIFGGLYVYRSIESRIVVLENRVNLLENRANFVGGNR